ncbi:ABC transporter permease subunit, partial [Ralstonia solanacearum]
MPHFDLSMLLSGQYHQWLVSGFFLSIKLSVLAFVLALPLGIVVALLRMAPSAPLRAIGQAFVEAIRNVPLLAHMLFWYFGAPQLLPNAVRTWLYDLNYEAASAVIALVLYTAAYMAEDIRSGLRSIPKEQLEASRALGLSFLQAMRR